MLELGAGADILRGLGWLYIGLMVVLVIAALWLPERWWQKLIGVIAVLLVFTGPAYLRDRERSQIVDESKVRYQAAKALFDERCKMAGEKIYRTAENVEGVLLLKIRQYDVAQSNPMMAGAAAAHESYGDFYIRSFLLYERESVSNAARALIEDGTMSSRPGYRFVDVIDPVDHKRYRYTLGSDLRAKRDEAIGPPPRYGVTFEDIVDPEERKHWVAGSTVSRDGLDLLLSYSASDSVSIKNWFAASARPIEQVRFGDGTTWTAAQIDALVKPPVLPIVGTPGNDTLNGTAGNDKLEGLAGNDALDGKAGADIMAGGIGNDTYYVDNTSDVVTELAGEGIDTVRTTVTHTLADNVEGLMLNTTTAIDGTGNALDNVLYAGAGDNALDGRGGSDYASYIHANSAVNVSLAATGAQDTMGSGFDTLWNIESLYGSNYGDVLIGSPIANMLNGGIGKDTLRGGAGNDIYYVDNSADVVTELANEGTDLVLSTVSSTLSADVENLSLTGTAAIDATGNALDNLLTGNTANNTLSGGSGNDTLNGSGGADTMTGGVGNDMYFVDNTADVVTELAGEGTDTVRTSISHTLAANVENLMLNTTAAIDGTGNALSNVLYAGAGDNVLDGLGGNDWVSYAYAGSAVNVSLATTGAQATGGSGTDTLRNVEYLFGSNYNDILTGSSRADVLSGGLGNDTLDGAAGADTLNGGAGHDTYRYRSGDGNDTVLDTGGDDTVELLDLNPGDVRIIEGLNGNPDHIVDALTGYTITLDLQMVSPGWSADGKQVEHLRFADGTVWNSEQMRAAAEMERSVSLLVQAMATFAVPAPGQTTWPQDHQNSLAPLLAVDWR